jgi:hypothetical protein
MRDFIFLMHNDAQSEDESAWGPYFAKLRSAGRFEGGSAIGKGACICKPGTERPATAHLAGYIRITAKDFAEAKSFLEGNPVYEAGGTVEIRELPKT